MASPPRGRLHGGLGRSAYDSLRALGRARRACVRLSDSVRRGHARGRPAHVRHVGPGEGQRRGRGSQVIFAGDSVQQEAEDSGIPHLEDLATNLNNEFSTWLLTEAEAGRPYGPELVTAIDEFESYCAEEGAPVR